MEYERHELTQPLYGGVNVLRIGDTLVDTGHVAPVSRDALREALAGPLDGIDRVLHTHPHIDHVGGSQTIEALADLPHVVPEGERDILYDYTDYLRRAREEMAQLLAGFPSDATIDDDYFPIQEYYEERIDITRELRDGDIVELGEYELEAVSTPGHAAPHLAFWHEPSGTLFSGDLVDANGRFQYGPLLGDVGDYKESLRRIRDLDLEILVPMHGPELTDPEARIRASLADAERTEARLLRFLGEHGSAFAREFVIEELSVEGPRAGFITLIIYEYLRHLDERGDVEMWVTDEGIRAEL
ncbi:MBL fold metallo-hydrolase [Natronomonas amylolytica]|uniref:MBL fold metallo-hydrolase n=1 Tax=Natronomonas amylolytica TaxID=3108498 RepID=UPI00300977B5